MIINLMGAHYKLLEESSPVSIGSIIRKPFDDDFKYFNIEAFNDQTLKYYLTPVDGRLRNEMAIFLSKEQMINQKFEILD